MASEAVRENAAAKSLAYPGNYFFTNGRRDRQKKRKPIVVSIVFSLSFAFIGMGVKSFECYAAYFCDYKTGSKAF